MFGHQYPSSCVTLPMLCADSLQNVVSTQLMAGSVRRGAHMYEIKTVTILSIIRSNGEVLVRHMLA